jgi:hypothetical protein
MRHTLKVAASLLVAASGVLLFAKPVAAAATVVPTQNSAGYSATAPSPFTTFSGTLNVPIVTCPATGDIFMGANIQLTPTTVSGYSVLLGWFVQCNSGTITYTGATAAFCPSAGGVCDPSGNTNTVPGDSIHLSVTQNTVKGTTTVTVNNVTEKQSVSAVLSATPSYTSILPRQVSPMVLASATPPRSRHSPRSSLGASSSAGRCCPASAPPNTRCTTAPFSKSARRLSGRLVASAPSSSTCSCGGEIYENYPN